MERRLRVTASVVVFDRSHRCNRIDRTTGSTGATGAKQESRFVRSSAVLSHFWSISEFHIFGCSVWQQRQ
jgi:hypothetical protein